MTDAAARLVVGYGSNEPQEFLLTAQTTTLGRETINDIVLTHPEVSRRHMRFTQMAGRFIIEDLGSTNGTFLNGRRINAPSPLLNGDVIDLGGSLRLTFFGPPGAAEATIIEKPGERTADSQGVGSPTADDIGPAAAATAYAPSEADAPADQEPALPPPFQAPEPGKRDWQRYLIGCGCLVALAVVACGVTLFLVDRYEPDLLYCGPLRFIFETLGYNCS